MKYAQFVLLEEQEVDPFGSMKKYIKPHEGDVDSLIQIIEKNCDINNYVYRGFSGDDAYLVDSKAGKKRKSAHTSNHYTMILDAIFDSKYPDYPKRSDALICTTSKSKAGMYGDLYMVFPFKGTKIMSTESNDIWNSKVKLGVLNFEIHEWNKIFKKMKLKDKNFGDFIADLKLRHKDSVEYIMRNAKDKLKKDNPTDKEVYDYMEDYEFIVAGSTSLHVEVNLKTYKYLFEMSLLVHLFGFDTDKIEDIIVSAYDPKSLGFDAHEVSDLNGMLKGNSKELWFAGKAVVIKESAWNEHHKKK